MSHTPGPWHAEYSSYAGYDCMSGGWFVLPEGAFRLPIVVVEECREPTDEHKAECEANARLIAAAPELLEALQNLCAVPRADGWPATEAAKKIIAKATGGAQ